MSKLIRIQRLKHYGFLGWKTKLNPEVEKIFAHKKVIMWRFRMDLLYIEYEDSI